ncbi:MSMEG_0567/sll0787 family protein [Marisediminicola senii]|uniref:MSMEG_0567/sll0787 family protein n=1 Tax=Marisediminicola senii TaxID=2711233 RepID=UPI0013EC008A|nr:MSMEG_0567/sll0787 family protein [Marisediminicola senii]
MDVPMLMGAPPAAPDVTSWVIVDADRAQREAYFTLRRDVFVAEQGLFAGSDRDDTDDDPRTIVLVAVAGDGTVVGGVRLAPATPGRDLGWWTGGRLVVARTARRNGGVGPALVRSACARALAEGVLRFEATVQRDNTLMFEKLGWTGWGAVDINGVDHERMRWPISRIASLVASTKSFLATLLEPYGAWGDSSAESLGGNGFVGDDGAPVPGTDVIAATDAILPLLIDRDPEWAGWCAVLVNVNDLAAMGAAPVGIMNAIGARDVSFARRIFNGLHSGARAWGVPILGGHTQVGVSSALSVTALGRTDRPVPGGGGRLGHAISITADLAGQWRRGFEGAQWDSSSGRSGAELQALTRMVRDAQPAAAKDISMAGAVGTVGMMAEASGYGATLDVDHIPTPHGATMGDWLTCFPGFAMVTADVAGRGRMHSPLTTTAEVGELTMQRGVSLRWPDGVVTDAVPDTVTGLGRA